MWRLEKADQLLGSQEMQGMAPKFALNLASLPVLNGEVAPKVISTFRVPGSDC